VAKGVHVELSPLRTHTKLKCTCYNWVILLFLTVVDNIIDLIIELL
jgi:hypothetical protein